MAEEVSRQRLWQLRKRAAGRCTQCGGPIGRKSQRGKGSTKDLCAIHAQARRDRMAKQRMAAKKKARAK